MDDVSVEQYWKFEQRMLKPFDSLVERIVEFNINDNSVNFSKGFADVPSESQREIIRNSLEKCRRRVPAFKNKNPKNLDIDEGESSSDIFFESDQGLFLVDSQMGRIFLFLFDSRETEKWLSELMSQKELIARVNSEMIEALRAGEAGLPPDELVSLANLLIDSLPERLNSLANAMKGNSWDTIRSQAHYLKSSFGVMGFERLSWLMTNLELATKNKDTELAFASYELIYPELIVAIKFLRDEFKAGDPTTTSVV